MELQLAPSNGAKLCGEERASETTVHTEGEQLRMWKHDDIQIKHIIWGKALGYLRMGPGSSCTAFWSQFTTPGFNCFATSCHPPVPLTPVQLSPPPNTYKPFFISWQCSCIRVCRKLNLFFVANWAKGYIGISGRLYRIGAGASVKRHSWHSCHSCQEEKGGICHGLTGFS